MSLDKKSTHIRLDPEVDHMLAVLADLSEKDKAEFAASLLTKSIVGEFHMIRLAAERWDRVGLAGINRDHKGS